MRRKISDLPTNARLYRITWIREAYTTPRGEVIPAEARSILVTAPSAHLALLGHDRRYGLVREGSRDLQIVR